MVAPAGTAGLGGRRGALLDGQVDAAVDAAAPRSTGPRRPGHPGTSPRGCSSWGSRRSPAVRARRRDIPADARVTLRRAATLAESLGTVPLIWPARALLGALVSEDDAAESARSLSAARTAVLVIAGDLPPGVRAEWLGRADVAALLEG